MQLIRSIFVLSATVLMLNAQAQDTNSPTRELSLAQCIALAVTNNRDLQIERINPQISRATLDASLGVYDPVFSSTLTHSDTATPSLGQGQFNPATGNTSYGSQNETGSIAPGFSGSLPSGATYSATGSLAESISDSSTGGHSDQWNSGFNIYVKQPLLKNLWIDQNRLTIQVNRLSLKQSELTFLFRLMDIITQVEGAYYDLVYNREFLKVQESTLGVKQRFFEETRRKAEVGTQAELDVKLAESDVAKIQADLVSARNAVVLSENTLKGLLGDNITSRHGVALRPTDPLLVIPTVPNLMDSWQRGVTTRPDLLAMKEDVEKANIQLKYAYNQLFPQLDLAASYGRNGIGTGWWPAMSMLGPSDPDAPKDMVSGTLTIPLTRRTDRANYRNQRATKAQYIVKLKQKEESVVKEIDDAVQNVKSSLERVHATRFATQYAEAALDAETKKLAAGKSTAYFVLSLQTSLASAQADEIRAKTDYMKNLATLSFREASTLDRKHIVVDIR